MLQALVITLREGVEAALILGIVLAYLQKIGRADLSRTVYLALGAAIAASLVGGVLLSGVDFNQELFEGWMMLSAAVLVLTLVLWMHRKAAVIKSELERSVGEIARRGAAAFWLFIFVFFAILREGVETVLFLGAISLTSAGLLEMAGAGAGLALAILFGVSFVGGSLRINLRKFFRVTTAILLLIAVQLTVSGLHELSEAGALPASKREMAIIGPLVSNDAFFFIAMVALAVILLLFEPGRKAAGEPEGRAARRKALFLEKRERLWRRAAAASAFLIVLFISAAFVYSRSDRELSPALAVSARDGQVRIPLDGLGDGRLQRYVLDVDGHAVRFIAIKTGEGRYGTAFDACQICGTSGYFQRGSNVICLNCEAVVYTPAIGRGGGCNPIPLPSRLENGELVISTSDLEAMKQAFAAPAH